MGAHSLHFPGPCGAQARLSSVSQVFPLQGVEAVVKADNSRTYGRTLVRNGLAAHARKASASIRWLAGMATEMFRIEPGFKAFESP